MFFSKKGAWNTLGRIILVLIVGVILLLILSPLLKEGSRAADITSCRNWAVLQSSVKLPGADIRLKEFSNPCVTLQDELNGNKYEIYETLAKGMYDTWKMYGQGKVDFFSDWDWFKKNTHCLIGDEIKIGKVKENEIDINDFEEYLSNTYVPKSEITYTEFFTGVKNTKLDFGSGKINLRDNDKIYTLFTVKKMREPWSIGEVVKPSILGCVIGGAIGAEVGTLIPIGVTTIAGAVGGCKLGFIVSNAIAIISIPGQAEALYPGLILISGENILSLEKSCDGGLYYKPK